MNILKTYANKGVKRRENKHIRNKKKKKFKIINTDKTSQNQSEVKRYRNKKRTKISRWKKKKKEDKLRKEVEK